MELKQLCFFLRIFMVQSKFMNEGPFIFVVIKYHRKHFKEVFHMQSAIQKIPHLTGKEHLAHTPQILSQMLKDTLNILMFTVRFKPFTLRCTGQETYQSIFHLKLLPGSLKVENNMHNCSTVSSNV